MKIIVNGKGYPEKRNIIVSDSHSYLNLKYKNIWLYRNAVRQRLMKANKLFVFSPLPFSVPGDAQVIHLFNEVATTQKPWISTFETELPRVLPVPGISKWRNPELKKQLRQVAAPQCKAIIAISEATKNIQMKLLEAFPGEAAAILPKLHTLHPPQAVISDRPRSAAAGKRVFSFVGNEFYRKGGAEVVLAFSELLQEGVIDRDSVEVNLVGDLSNRYNIAHGAYQDNAAFYQQIETLINQQSIFRHVAFMQNTLLMDLLRQTDVGLLPTWQDTYGFSVLEMQACGCPVITTNVRALPEINPSQAGWLLHCPLDEMFEISLRSAEEKQRIRRQVVAQLKQTITDILAQPESVRSRSAMALQRIKTDHDPARFRASLDAFYQLAARATPAPVGEALKRSNR
ncbi:glycosyltransferase family 4 protein [Candidatus Pantoea soli]|uniref:Glycosyltransferase n=1 Tax=Candidatus Pantoea soli TaxID=3098669 RepID=A0A518XCB8_9GAMM|nr:glycosyltransferase family 4 protein [Pantoea soli]QDY41841.1 glycosyltransferase [Pantoea soli]